MADRTTVTGFGAGAVIGILGGLIGLLDAEFRSPLKAAIRVICAVKARRHG